jgi:hypothetical protein
MSQFHRANPEVPHPFAHEVAVADYWRDEQRSLREADAEAKAEAALRDELLSLARAADLDAAAPFAAPVLDHRNRTPYGIPTRPATLHDVLSDAVDYEQFQRRLFQVLLTAARVDADAAELLSDMAGKWASMNVEGV